MTVEQVISDTLAVTNYLRNRFHKEKIYLMAHSGGSFLAYRRLPGRRSCTTPTWAWVK
jgi:alpha-beta hydrolase superfamily lysophospholipase